MTKFVVNSVIYDTHAEIPADGTHGQLIYCREHDELSVWGATGFSEIGGGGVSPTAAEIADAVLDELLSGHLTIGSMAFGMPRSIVKQLDFTGAAGLGAVGNVPIFNIAGRVNILRMTAYCADSLVSTGGNIKLGIEDKTDLFIASTLASGIDGGHVWVDQSPDSNGIAIPSALMDIWIRRNIVIEVTDAAVSDGTFLFEGIWVPISADGNLVPA